MATKDWYEGELAMQEKNIVKFKNPMDEDEKSSVMVVLEMRGDRALVSDLRFSEWAVPPTDVYSIDDPEVVEDLSVRE